MITYGAIIVPPILIYIVTLAVIIVPIMNQSVYWAAILAALVGLVAEVIPFLIASIHLKLVRNEEKRNSEYIMDEIKGNGFRYFIGSLLFQLYVFLWTLLLWIPGIIKQHSYAMTPFIMRDDKTIGANKAITESRKMMDGHKKSLFFLMLSYILPPILLYFSAVLIALIVFSLMSDSLLLMGLIVAVLVIIAIIGSAILLIRNLPRFNTALALFYEDIRSEREYISDETVFNEEDEF